jgi:hypothetical protein
MKLWIRATPGAARQPFFSCRPDAVRGAIFPIFDRQDRSNYHNIRTFGVRVTILFFANYNTHAAE